MHIPFIQVHDIEVRSGFTVLIGTDEFLPDATQLGELTLADCAPVLCCRGGARIELRIAGLQFSTSLIEKRNLFLKIERVDLSKELLRGAILLVSEDAIADQSRYRRHPNEP